MHTLATSLPDVSASLASCGGAAKQTLNVNLYAGPGVGKSVTAAALFVALKMRGVHAELVNEYAKELVYDGVIARASQRDILREQVRRQARLQGKVDVVVTDAPPLITMLYARQLCEPSLVEELEQYLAQATQGWWSLEVLLHRDVRQGYEQGGRYQSPEQAREFHEQGLVPFLEQRLPHCLHVHARESLDHHVGLLQAQVEQALKGARAGAAR